MPELPEVETVKRQLQKSLVNKKIKDVFVYMDKMVKVGDGKISNIKTGSKLASRKFAGVLRAKKIISLDRRAKFLIIKLSGGYALLIHLRMSGQLIFLSRAMQKNPLLLSLAKTAIKQTLPTKHTHVEFVFTEGSKLFYNDTRQFGHLRLVNAKEFKKVLAEAGLGPEPLKITLRNFTALVSAHSEKPAKDFLLNQQIIAGIGNIYADESLFAAKIRPTRKVKTLKLAEIKALHNAIKKILTKAIKLGGSSIEYFLMTNGSAGKYTNEHEVYGRAGKPCPRCGRILKSAKIAGRTTVFCAKCQK